MKFRPTLVAFGLGILASAAGWSAVANAEGNVERGKILAYTCHGCHGVPGYKNAYPSYSVPKLGGQSAAYLVNALKAYASGERLHPTMHAHAATMSEQDRADIAAYLQGAMVQSGKEVVGTPPPATQTCAACHGADGAKVALADSPILAGQQPDYIVHALQDYKSGKRKNPVMAGIIGAIDTKDFDALAQFFARQPGLCSTDEILEHSKCVAGKVTHE